MPSLKEFVAALQAGWFPALAAFVGCSIIVLGDYFKVPYLDSSPSFLLVASVSVGVFSFSVLVANIAYVPIIVWKAIQNREKKKRLRKHFADEIEAAPNDEKAILAYLVTSGRNAFSAKYNDPRLSPLVSKGFLIKMGGTNSVLEWPYIVRREVWDYLLENQEHYRAKLPESGHDPFHWLNSN